MSALAGRALARRDLGREVKRRADDRALGGERGLAVHAGEAEVGDAGTAGGLEEDVGGLQVAVKDAAAVGEVDRVRALGDDPRRVDVGDTLAADHAVERRPLDELHGEVVDPVRLPALVEADDPVVVEAGDGLGLAVEALDALGVEGHARGEDLERDLAVELDVARREDGPHGAAPELLQDLVGTDPRAGSEGQRPGVEPAARRDRLVRGQGVRDRLRRVGPEAHRPGRARGLLRALAGAGAELDRLVRAGGARDRVPELEGLRLGRLGRGRRDDGGLLARRIHDLGHRVSRGDFGSH